MKFRRYVLFLSLLIFGCDSRTNEMQEQPDANNTFDLAGLFPCWNQTWECGEWQPLTHKLDSAECIEGCTPDGKVLIMSLCQWCGSLRLVEPEQMRERMVLSFEARRNACQHVWRPAFASSSFDPIRQGDLLVVLSGQRMYVLVIKSFSFFDEELAYDVAMLTDIGRFVTKVDLKRVPWRSGTAADSIGIGCLEIEFVVERVQASDMRILEEFVCIKYDNYYGVMGRSKATPSHIAIVHRSDIGDDSVVDLTQFRFKTWEDGLGNRCDCAAFDNSEQRE
jgi:hypothetical protein